MFRGTGNPGYAEGRFGEGVSGGGLEIYLGGVDNSDRNGMSGAWVATFNVAQAAAVTLSFRYNMTQSPEYEGNEFSQVLAALDGNVIGAPGSGGDWIARVTGNGPGGGELSTGWQSVELNLGTLSAGTHSLALGGFNNLKTYGNEITRIQFDDVTIAADSGGSASTNSAPTAILLNNTAIAENSIGAPIGQITVNDPDAGDTHTLSVTGDDRLEIDGTTLKTKAGQSFDFEATPSVPFTLTATDAGGLSKTQDFILQILDQPESTPPPPTTTTLIDADFSSGAEGFAYRDDAFRGSSQPSYASGASNDALTVTLGGIDTANIFGMSGGWARSFTLILVSYVLTKLGNAGVIG